jgi:homoserine dehydrogenase
LPKLGDAFGRGCARRLLDVVCRARTNYYLQNHMTCCLVLEESSQTVKQIIVAHIGAGTVGGAAILQEVTHRQQWRRTHGIDVAIGALIGTGGAIVASTPAGLPDELLEAIAAERRSGLPIAECAEKHGKKLLNPIEAIEQLVEYGSLIVMDAGAGKQTAELDVAALEQGGSVVLSNKAPLSLPEGSLGDALWAETGPTGRVRYEATCGAGLPIISTLRSLIDTGDVIEEITGTVSGTFGAIFSDVASGDSFSTAVRTANANGYTEPDPRDDLSGLDVARKGLILARTIGRKVELSDIEIEGLVPDELKSVSVQQFLDAICSLDESIAARSAQAKADNSVLKYVATVRPDGALAVGIAPVSTGTVLGALQGPENIVSIRTRRYDRYPLNITGPGAGAAVTAAGMIADMLALSQR